MTISDTGRAAGLVRVGHLRARLDVRDLTGPCSVPFCPNLDVTVCAEHGCQHPPREVPEQLVLALDDTLADVMARPPDG
jgi:hypothetical protein